MQPEVKALESFNVELCRATGAGQGHATTDEARAAYSRELARRADECSALIAACDSAKIRSHYVDGIRAALARAIADNPPHPFPFPTGNRADWTARDWQAAANRYWYDIMGVDRSEPNYRPQLSMLEAAHKEATRKAAALRRAAA